MSFWGGFYLPLFFPPFLFASKTLCLGALRGPYFSRFAFVFARWPHGRSHPTRRDRKKGVALPCESPRYNMGRFTPIFVLYLNIKYLFIYFSLFFILYLLFAFFCLILLLGDLLLCLLIKIFFWRFYYDHQCYR